MSRTFARCEVALGAHAARVLAVLVAFSARSVLGWLVAFPVISAVAALGAGSLEGADRALFAPSGMLLAELVRSGSQTLWAAGETSLVLVPVALGLLAFPTALMFAAFGEPAHGVRGAVALARNRVGRFIGFEAIEVAVIAAVVGAAWLVMPLPQAFDTAAREASYLVLGSVALLVVAVSSIVLDVARRECVASGRALASSLARSWDVFSRRWFSLATSYVLATGAAAFIVALVARAVELCSVDREGVWRVGLAFLLHQVALLALTFIESAWVLRVAHAEAPPSTSRIDSSGLTSTQ